jgi:hypothetical protein
MMTGSSSLISRCKDPKHLAASKRAIPIAATNCVGRADRSVFDPHGYEGVAIANHCAISPVTASLESDVDGWIHMPAVT